MNITDYYSSKLAVITSIPDKDISKPVNIPVHIYAQEAELLKCWCHADKEKLIAGGLDWSLVEDLPARIDTLREAQSIWSASTDDINLKKKWREITTEARELRQLLLHHMRFIFRKNPAALAGIRKFSEGNSHIAIIQALYDIAIFGEDRIELLEAARFDITLLRRAADLSGEMASLYAVVTNTRRTPDKKLKIRNQAYTHLAEAVEEIRFHAKHIFWKNPAKLECYRSEYTRRKNRRYKQNCKAKELIISSEESTAAAKQVTEAPERYITATKQITDTPEICITPAKQVTDATERYITASKQVTDAPERYTTASKQITDEPKVKTGTLKAETESLKRETKKLKPETNRPNSRTKSAEAETNATEWCNYTLKVYPGHHEQCNNIIIH
jgi:hypothetical protein